MKNSENIKCVKLKDALVKRIISGEYPFNVQFPGVHKLVAEYGVSYVTALKSLKLLEEEGFLQCRRGKGYFTLYSDANNRPKAKCLNLVLHQECWERYSLQLKQNLARFREAGWNVEIVPLQSTDVHEASVAINSPDAYTIFYCLTADWGRFTATFPLVCNRVLVLGKLSGSPQVTSVICDESQTVSQILDYLRKKGRKRPGIFCGSLENELEMYRLAYWRMSLQNAGLDTAWIQEHIFPLASGNDGVLTDSQRKDVCRQMTEHLRAHRKDMDAIIVPYSSTAFKDACRHARINIPDELLPVHIDSPRWAPDDEDKLPTLDHNIAAHFETALNILEHRHATGKKETGSWYFCQPLGVKDINK